MRISERVGGSDRIIICTQTQVFSNAQQRRRNQFSAYSATISPSSAIDFHLMVVLTFILFHLRRTKSTRKITMRGRISCGSYTYFGERRHAISWSDHSISANVGDAVLARFSPSEEILILTCTLNLADIPADLWKAAGVGHHLPLRCDLIPFSKRLDNSGRVQRRPRRCRPSRELWFNHAFGKFTAFWLLHFELP